RWTGELIMENMNVNVLARNTLTINKSGTANRTTLLNNAFVNPTILTCKAGSKLEVDGSATVIIEDETTFKMEAGSEVNIRPGATFIVRNNSVLDIADDALFTVMGGGTLIVEDGSEVITRNTK